MSPALLVLAPILGIDNMVAAAGIAYVKSSRRTCIETCILFGCFAAIAVALGTSVGSALSASLAHGGRIVAGLILASLGLRLLWPSKDHAALMPEPRISTPSIAILGVALSTDTLAASVALGAAGAVQGAVAVPIISAGTVAMTTVGLAIGGNATRVTMVKRPLAGAMFILAGCGVAFGWL